MAILFNFEGAVPQFDSNGRKSIGDIVVSIDQYDNVSFYNNPINLFDSPILLSDSACNKIEDIVDVAIIACQQNSLSPYYQNTPVSTSFEEGDYSKVQSLCTKGVMGVPQFLDYGEICAVQSCIADSDTGNYSFTVVLPHIQNNEQYFRATIEIHATISNSNSASVNVWIEYIGEQAIM